MGDVAFNCSLFSGATAHSPFASICETPPRCMNHGFAVHTKYELAPPYPAFTPKVFLKLDGVVILNTGKMIHQPLHLILLTRWVI